VPSFFGGGFPPLPGTALEAEVIPPLVAGSQLVVRGTEATEESVLSVKSPRVLHLATHGFFIQDTVLPLPDQVASSGIVGGGQGRGVGGIKNLSPLPTENRPSSVALSAMVRSGLAFAGANHAASASSGNDGILTALEVTGMDLRGTELVVLSACETAVGQVSIGEGIFGLRRAFVLAGAENLVMSLWLVNDDLTVTQMERFYRGFGDGEPIPEALRQAQLESIATLRGLTQEALGEAIAPVRLWAPFIVQQTGL
ncbi:MAG: CHAT domain-containing protein, partial [Dehalococcoidia bacterium]